MRENTPPTSPYNINDDDFDEDGMEAEDIGEMDELIYIGDADEVLNQLEREDDGESEDENAEADDVPVVPQRDDAILTFHKHTGPVFCGSLHPTENLAVTGGEDDKAYVWSTETGNVVFEVTGHNDSVIAVEFSPDGNFLATGDMAGEMQVFKVNNDYNRHWEFSMGDMVWMKWHRAANVLMAGAETGEVFVWRFPTGDCKVLMGNGHKSEAGTLTADGKRLIVGYGDGTIKLWDIKSSTAIQEILSESPLGHTGSVTCIAADPDNGMFLSGSEDGKILLAGNSGPLGNLLPDAGSVEALVYCPDSDVKLVACGTLAGKISLWDIAKQSIRTECQHTESIGITRLTWAPNHTLLSGTLDGRINGFDGRSGQLKFKLEGHTAEIYEMDYNRSKDILLTTSEDHTAKIFKAFVV